MTSSPLIAEEALSVLNNMSQAASQRAKILRQQADAAAHEQDEWAKFNKHLRKGWYVHILDFMARNKPLVDKVSLERPDIPRVIDAVVKVAKEQADLLFRRFPSYLQQAAIDHKLPLDADSRHPRYSFESGFFRLEIDEAKRYARFSDYEGRLADFPADIEAIVETFAREHARVFDRPFDGAKFLLQLRSQYLAVLKKSGGKDGDSLPIRQITQRLGKNQKGFRTDEFLFDLSRLAQHGPHTIAGFQVDFQQTKDTEAGMFLHIPGRQTYVGFVVFRRV